MELRKSDIVVILELLEILIEETINKTPELEGFSCQHECKTCPIPPALEKRYDKTIADIYRKLTEKPPVEMGRGADGEVYEVHGICTDVAAVRTGQVFKQGAFTQVQLANVMSRFDFSVAHAHRDDGSSFLVMKIGEPKVDTALQA